MSEAFWARIDARIAAGRAGIPEAASAAEGARPPPDAGAREDEVARDALAALLRAAREEVRSLEALLRERQAEADARVRAAEARARAADLRAEAAEGWLRRIEGASRDLLPGARRAAAALMAARVPTPSRGTPDGPPGR